MPKKPTRKESTLRLNEQDEEFLPKEESRWSNSSVYLLGQRLMMYVHCIGRATFNVLCYSILKNQYGKGP